MPAALSSTRQEDSGAMRLVAHRITKRFGGVTALSNVSMSIGRDEMVGLIGPNGSGKTTFLNAVTGVVVPEEGEFSLGSHTWRRERPDRLARRGIARTFQNIRLFHGLTVLENIGVAAAVAHGKAWKQQVDRIVDLLMLAPWIDRLPSTLPYGIQRRVELGRAAVASPLFLLLDEPAAGLNPEESHQLETLLLQLREELKCGALLIDHNVRLVMDVCARVVVLSDGSVIAEGRPVQVRSDPRVIQAYLG